MANDRINEILKDLTEDEIQQLKDTIRYCCWGDSYAEFLTDGEVIEDSMFAYCINDAKKVGRFSGRKISSMFRSIKSKVCPTGKGEVISHCSHWWGDGSGDMLFIRYSWVDDFEKWCRE